MEIVFLTLFLGVTTTGLRPVQVQVPPGTAAVVIRLDEEHVAGLTGPPWSVTVDFGEELVPHELQASAFDSDGKLLATARQAVNMPHPLAEAYLAVEKGPGGKRAARLSWKCAVATKPRDVRVTWDGNVLEVADPSTFVLPRVETGSAHILRAELDFGSGITATAEALVGSKNRDFSSAELTAVPLVALEGRQRMTVDDLAGALSARGRPLKAVAVEEGPADVVFVVDPGAEPLLDALQRDVVRSRPSHLGLSKGIVFSFTIPAPSAYPETGFEIYPSYGPLDQTDGTVLAAYRRVRRLFPKRDGEFLPRAARVSGIDAVKNSRRRAVVWVLGADFELSDPSMESARGFLRALNVPLFIWRVFPSHEERRFPEGETAVSAPWQLEKAIGTLESALKRQRIVWVEGRHLPQTIALAAGARGFAIAR